MTGFRLIGAHAVRSILDSDRQLVLDIVRQTYLLHHAGRTVNPDSLFLRFPDAPENRIIALPARVVSDRADDAGLKWIGSFPGNTHRGLPRASAVVILNDMSTGRPYACIEGSRISAARTAASAAIAARHLHPVPDGQRLGVVGCGVIARSVCDFLEADGWRFTSIATFDTDPARAAALPAQVGMAGADELCLSVEDVVRRSDIVVFATTTASPHVVAVDLFAGRHTVLHLSLRDLATGVILGTQNFVDDIDHALKAGTSLHLAEQAVRHRDFVSGTLAEVIRGEVRPRADPARVFSPFGLGALDVAVARMVYQRAVELGLSHDVPGFLESEESAP